MSVAVTHVDVRASAVANARALERSSAQFYALQTDLLMESNREGAEHDVQYAVDVVEQNNRFGIIGRGGNFMALSNFNIDFRHEVAAGCLSGFVCSVTLYNGNSLGYD